MEESSDRNYGGKPNRNKRSAPKIRINYPPEKKRKLASSQGKKAPVDFKTADSVCKSVIRIERSDFEQFRESSGNLLDSVSLEDRNLMEKIKLSYWAYLDLMEYLPQRTSIHSFVAYARKNGYQKIPSDFSQKWRKYCEEMKKKPRAAAIIFDKSSRYVLMVQGFGEEAKFALPGGRVEDGEETLAALQREMKEELGMELPISSREAIIETSSDVTTTAYVCLNIDLDEEFGPTVNAEIKTIFWMK